MSAISDRVLYRDIVHNTIVYLLPNLVRSVGDKRRGASHRKMLGVAWHATR